MPPTSSSTALPPDQRQSHSPLVPLLLAVGVAIPVALIVGGLSGALAPVALSDSGPLVRYGLPLVRVIHDISAAVAVGALLVGAFLAPEGKRTDRRGHCARLASGAAIVWGVTASAGVILGYADIAGLPLSTPGLLADLMQNAWPLEVIRLWMLEAALALLLVPIAAVVRTRAGLAWAFFYSLIALMPLAFASHTSGSEGHDQAMTGLVVHLVAVCAWVGGLLAIIAMRQQLGPALAVTVQRFSTVALWAYVAVGLSGVTVALVQADSWSDLTTSYWWVMWAKVAAIVVLGWFGWSQRRRILAGGLERPGAFVRFSLTELAVMSATVGLAVALSRTPPPELESTIGDDPMFDLTGYQTPDPFTAESLLTAWRVEWLFLPVALIAAGLYLAGVRRLKQRGDTWPLRRTVNWLVGLSIFVYVTNGAPGVYGHATFSMHMTQHMALMMVIPIFLVPANPITLALRTLPSRRDRTLGPREMLLGVVHSRWAGFIANPLVAGLIFFGSLVAFYWTDIFGIVMGSHVGHVLMVAHFTLVGYAFVWSLIGTDPGPAKWPAPLRLCVLLGTIAAHAFFGLSIAQGTWLLAPGYFKGIDIPWMNDLLADQQLGGQIAWGVGELPTMILALLVTLDWMRSDRRDQQRYDRKADRDDDAELAAYNARLQELNQDAGNR